MTIIDTVEGAKTGRSATVTAKQNADHSAFLLKFDDKKWPNWNRTSLNQVFTHTLSRAHTQSFRNKATKTTVNTNNFCWKVCAKYRCIRHSWVPDAQND